MASTFSTIAIVSLILGVVFLIAAGVIFVKLKIWLVMADLSGKTAQLSIEQLRNQSGKPAKRTQHRSYVANSAALKRSKGTDELRTKGTEQIGKRFGKKTDVLKKEEQTMPLMRNRQTEKLSEQMPAMPDATDVLDEGTELLNAGTAVLNEGTELLNAGTAVLNEGTELLGTAILAEGTTLLKTDATTVIDQTKKTKAGFRIITDIVMINTDETID